MEKKFSRSETAFAISLFWVFSHAAQAELPTKLVLYNTIILFIELIIYCWRDLE